MRRLVNRGFTPRVINVYEPRVREIAEEFVAEMIERGADGGADLVRDLTYPLPVTVIAEMLGIPADRREQFKKWSDAAVAAFSLAPDAERFRVAAEEMFEFFVEVVEDRRANPGDDLVSMLVSRGADDEEPLTLDELVGFCILLLIAGNETTTNLLGNWMRTLVDRPDVEAALRADPSKIAASFEEQLRFDGPVQCLFRGVTAPTEVGGGRSTPEPPAWSSSRQRTATKRNGAPTRRPSGSIANRPITSASGTASTCASVRPSPDWRLGSPLKSSSSAPPPSSRAARSWARRASCSEGARRSR